MGAGDHERTAHRPRWSPRGVEWGSPGPTRRHRDAQPDSTVRTRALWETDETCRWLRDIGQCLLTAGTSSSYAELTTSISGN